MYRCQHLILQIFVFWNRSCENSGFCYLQILFFPLNYNETPQWEHTMRPS